DEPWPLLQIKCREAGTAKEDCGSRRDDRLHKNPERQQQGAKKSPGCTGVFGRAADDQQNPGDKKNIGHRIGESARRPLLVLHEGRAKSGPNRDGNKEEDQGERPMFRQEAAKQAVNKKWQRQNNRKIAQVTFTEDNVLEGAEISQPGSTVIKDLFASLQRSVKIAGQQFLQDQAPDAVVEDSIIAAIEWPNATQKTCIVYSDNQRRQRDDDSWQNHSLCSDSHKDRKQSGGGRQQQYAARKAGQTNGPWRCQMHGKRVRFETAAEYAFSNIGRLHSSASVTGHRSEMLALAFPHDRAAPAEFAADIPRRQTDHFEPRHGEI